METFTINKIVHLVGRKHNGILTTQCNHRFGYEKADLKPAKDVNPTCPKCLKHHFYSLRTNHHYRKVADDAYNRASKIMNALSTLVEAQRTKHAGDEECEEHKKGAYPFIPMSVGHAFNDFSRLGEYLEKEKRWSGHETNRIRFLDAGCGIGNVLLIASACQLAEEYHGIEYFDDTAKRAETWLGINRPKLSWNPDKFKIFQDDILTFDKYSEYDIVYFYCPMIEGRLQIRFEERLEDEMKVGSILVPRMKRGQMIHDDPRFEDIQGNKGLNSICFIKISDGPRIHSQIEETDRYGKKRKNKHEKTMLEIIKAGTLKT